MPNKLYISGDITPNNEWRNPTVHLYKNTSKIWLFMIGGTAAGIIPPLSRYFISNISKDIIVPIFIDSKIHSVNTSFSIADIEACDEYCKITCQKSKISPPFFFIENNLKDLLSQQQFQNIIDLIDYNDEIFISFSVHSEYNVSVALKIGELFLAKIHSSNLKYGIFLPYLTFYANDTIGEFLTEFKNKQSLLILNKNLELINRFNPECTKFFIGLSEKSIVNEASIQRNPLNLVQLIMASAVTNLMNKEGGSWFYSIPYKDDFLVAMDVVGNKEFRNLLIFHDFLCLAFSFLHKINFFPKKLQVDKELRKAIFSYLNAGTDLILSLGDETIHRKNRMLLRKDPNLSENCLNNIFSKKTLLGKKNYSERELAKMLLHDVDQHLMYNSNMAAHEILKSIYKFIKDRFSEISQLYY